MKRKTAEKTGRSSVCASHQHTLYYPILAIAAALAVLLTAGSVTPAALAADAPAGRPVASAEEFAAMEAGGEYWLAGDIELSGTYGKTFSGTLDGNGHTLTVSAPVFNQLSGTVMNLTVDGRIEKNSGNAAALALVASGCTLYRVVNNAEVSGKSATYIGGLVASSVKGRLFTAVGCVNNGDVTFGGGASSCQAGGIIGYCDSIEAWFCVNSGNISADYASCGAAGICGRAVTSAGSNYCRFYGCVNSGDVTGGQDGAGIIAYTGLGDNTALGGYALIGCANTGSIRGSRYAGGIAGYGYGTGGSEYFNIVGCMNTGKITGCQKGGGGFVSQIAAYCNTTSNIMTGCLAAGELAAEKTARPYFVIMGCSSQNPLGSGQIRSNFYCEEGQMTEWATYATADSNSPRRVNIDSAVTAGQITYIDRADLASGRAAFELNRELYMDMFRQKIGTDGIPMPLGSGGYLYEEGDAIANLEFPRFRLPSDAIEDIGIPYDPEDAFAETFPPQTEAPEPATAEPDQTVGTEPASSETTETRPVGGCSSAATGTALFIAALPAAYALVKKYRRGED